MTRAWIDPTGNAIGAFFMGVQHVLTIGGSEDSTAVFETTTNLVLITASERCWIKIDPTLEAQSTGEDSTMIAPDAPQLWRVVPDVDRLSVIRFDGDTPDGVLSVTELL